MLVSSRSLVGSFNHATTPTLFSYVVLAVLRQVLENGQHKISFGCVFLLLLGNRLERKLMEVLYCIFVCVFMLAAIIALLAASVVLVMCIKDMFG